MGDVKQVLRQVAFTCRYVKGTLHGMHNRVRELREAAGLTQEQLAAELNVSRQTIMSIEAPGKGGKSRYTPTLRLAIAIAEKFETTVEEVFISDQRAQLEA